MPTRLFEPFPFALLLVCSFLPLPITSSSGCRNLLPSCGGSFGGAVREPSSGLRPERPLRLAAHNQANMACFDSDRCNVPGVHVRPNSQRRRRRHQVVVLCRQEQQGTRDRAEINTPRPEAELAADQLIALIEVFYKF